MLYTMANMISEVLLRTIVMHPHIVSVVHIFTRLSLKMGFSVDTVIQDDTLLRLRLGYVIVAYVYITVSVILKGGGNRR